MADVDHDKNKQKEIEEQQEEIYHFKFTLSHTQHRSLERAVRDVLKKVHQLQKDEEAKIDCSGPSRMPTKTLLINTRKSPCGNGTNTYDNWEMRIHKRVIHIHCSQTNFGKIVSNVSTEPGMILEAENVDEEEEDQ